MTGTPTRSPGEGGWTHTRGTRLPLIRRATGQPIPATRRTPGDQESRGERPAGGQAARRCSPSRLTVARPRVPAGFPPGGGNPAWVGRSESRGGSARTDERGSQVLVDRCFRYPEGTSDPDCF